MRFRRVIFARRSDQGSRQAMKMKQSFVLGLDRRVAFARGSAEAIQVGDLDVSPAVADEIGLHGLSRTSRSEEHTSELQSHLNLVCRLLLEKKNTNFAHVNSADKA